MRNKDEVFLLFKFSHFGPNEELSGSGKYQVIFFFDYNGEVDFKEVKKANVSYEQDFENLEFITKDDLIEFGQNFISANNYQALYLLSASDYNIGIESCHDLHAFREIFKRYGNKLEAETSSQKSIFGKLF